MWNLLKVDNNKDFRTISKIYPKLTKIIQEVSENKDKVNNKDIRIICAICSKSTIRYIPADIYLLKVRRRSGAFIVNFKHISQLVLVFLLLTLNK